MNMRLEPGFLGTNASLAADITLLAYLLLLVPLMIVGFLYARRKMFEPNHKYVMTTITLLNWVLILLVMAVSYADSVAPQMPDGMNERFVLFPSIHLLTGATAQLLATYLVIRMWFEKSLPKWFMVKRIKRYMRTTLALWFITVALGITTYFIWYTPASAETSDSPVPAATEEATPEMEMTDEATPESEMTEEPEATEAASDDETPEPEMEMTEEASDNETPEPAETEETEAASDDDETPEPAETEETEAASDDDETPEPEMTEEPEPAATEETE